MTSEKIFFTHNTCHSITKHVKNLLFVVVLGFVYIFLRGGCYFFVCLFWFFFGVFLLFFFFIFLLLLFGFFFTLFEIVGFFQSISQTFASLFSINMSKILVKSQGKNNNWLETPLPKKNHLEKKKYMVVFKFPFYLNNFSRKGCLK